MRFSRFPRARCRSPGRGTGPAVAGKPQDGFFAVLPRADHEREAELVMVLPVVFPESDPPLPLSASPGRRLIAPARRPRSGQARPACAASLPTRSGCAQIRPIFSSAAAFSTVETSSRWSAEREANGLRGQVRAATQGECSKDGAAHAEKPSKAFIVQL